MAPSLVRLWSIVFVLMVSLCLPSISYGKTPVKKGGYLNRPTEQIPLHLGKTTTTSNTSTHAATGFQVGRLIFAMVIVVALIFGIRWLLQRVNPKSLKGFRQTDAIELKASKALPNGTSLHVIQIADKVMLIGAGANAVTKISDLSEEDLSYMEASDSLTRRSGRGGKKKISFGNTLGSVMSASSRLEEARKENSSGSSSKNFIDRLRDRTAR